MVWKNRSRHTPCAVRLRDTYPYLGLRDYEHELQIGAEPTPVEYVENLVFAFSRSVFWFRNDGRSGLRVRPKGHLG